MKKVRLAHVFDVKLIELIFLLYLESNFNNKNCKKGGHTSNHAILKDYSKFI